VAVKKVLNLQRLVGLKEEDVSSLQREFGKNIFKTTATPRLFIIIWDIVKEPMFILLCLACALYFVMGEADEGFLMLAAMLL
jgi:P-type Ca2+ transporter type 2C